MTRASQCLEDRIHIQEYERARLIKLRDSMLADEETVASLSAIVTTPANELADAPIRNHPNPTIKP